MAEFRFSGADGSAAASGRATDRSRETVPYDPERSVHAIVHQQAQAAPQATAIVFDDHAITYGELDTLSDALAAYLIDQGVTKGDIVCLFVPRSLETIVAMLAILKAGAAYLPLDTTFPVDHLDYVIGDCEPKVVFVDTCTLVTMLQVPSVKGTIADLRALVADLSRAQAKPFEPVGVSGGDMAYVMYTSGSTGRPKGVAIPHRGITRLALDQNYVELGSGDVVLHAATIAFDIATFEVWGTLTNGGTIAGLPDGNFSIGRLRDVIRDNGVTVSLITTGLFNLLADFSCGELPTLRHLMFGGEVASAEHVKRFQKAHPECRLTNGYGPTEITVIATAFDIPAGFDGKDVPIGRAVSHTGILIVDEDHRPVGRGMEGELVLTGEGVAIGYFRRPELTAERFVTICTDEGEVRGYLTGDLSVLGNDGILLFRGRRDRQIKLNGKRIELDEIEAALRRDPRLADGVVICQHLDQSHKRIVGYLCPREGTRTDDAELIRGVMERLRNSLPAYMIPSAVIVLDHLPLHQSGKVDRARLPLPVDALPTENAPVASRTEAILQELWCSVLGLQAVELDRNFFDFGGTSLQLMRVHAALEVKLARPIDVVALFKHTTVRELAGFLDGKSSASARTMTAAERAARQKKNMSHFRRSAS